MRKLDANYKSIYEGIHSHMESEERPAVITTKNKNKCVVWDGEDSWGKYYEYLQINASNSVTFIRIYEDGTTYTEGHDVEYPKAPAVLELFDRVSIES